MQGCFFTELDVLPVWDSAAIRHVFFGTQTVLYLAETAWQADCAKNGVFTGTISATKADLAAATPGRTGI